MFASSFRREMGLFDLYFFFFFVFLMRFHDSWLWAFIMITYTHPYEVLVHYQYYFTPSLIWPVTPLSNKIPLEVLLCPNSTGLYTFAVCLVICLSPCFLSHLSITWLFFLLYHLCCSFSSLKIYLFFTFIYFNIIFTVVHSDLYHNSGAPRLTSSVPFHHNSSLIPPHPVPYHPSMSSPPNITEEPSSLPQQPLAPPHHHAPLSRGGSSCFVPRARCKKSPLTCVCASLRILKVGIVCCPVTVFYPLGSMPGLSTVPGYMAYGSCRRTGKLSQVCA